ncbi:MAG: class I SAM-dependent methyltransferase, partial [Thermoanaerobaculia bacterium]
DAPGLLMNFAIALQGLRLLPGLSVLDFGAGTGWLSRMLTQLGCRVFVLDVSATALKMAEATYREIPIIGDRPRPEFVQFDGRTIPLGDLSVDRVLCFDAFHHSPNPDQMLREFARILKPGGIAGFIEPGPTHSQRPQSQFEMRTYGVLENDIDIAEIWRVAQTAGFDDLRLAVSNLTPFHVSLGEFHDLLEGYRGSTYLRWADKTRDYMRDVRNFFLFKRGTEAIDSRRAEQLRAAIAVEVLSQQPLSWRATITNSGGATWLPSTEAIGGVWLGAHLYDGEGRLIEFELGQWPVSSKAVLPDETVEITFTSRELVPGTYRIEFDCVAAHVAWFGQTGSRTTTVPLVILSREDGEGSPAGSR